MRASNTKIFLCKDEEEMIFVIDTLTTNIPDLKLVGEAPGVNRYYSDNEDCFYYVQTDVYQKVGIGTIGSLIVYRGNVGWKIIEESDK